jgi:hypothetical protein
MPVDGKTFINLKYRLSILEMLIAGKILLSSCVLYDFVI